MKYNLQKIQKEAKTLSSHSDLKYSQALQILSTQNGFKTYQALMTKVKDEYIQHEDVYIQDFKKNIFDNRKHIFSNFIKLKNLSEKYEQVRDSEMSEDEIEDELDDILNKANDISARSAKLIIGNEWHKSTDNNETSLVASAFAIYTTCDIQTFSNDIDAYRADYWLEFSVSHFTIELGFRYREGDEWLDWDGINIELP